MSQDVGRDDEGYLATEDQLGGWGLVEADGGGGVDVLGGDGGPCEGGEVELDVEGGVVDG